MNCTVPPEPPAVQGPATNVAEDEDQEAQVIC